MAALLVLAVWFPLTLNEGLDLSAAYKPGESPAGPSLVMGNAASEVTGTGTPPLNYEPGYGPTEVTVAYQVDPARASEFEAVMRDLARHRRRNGATRWRLEKDSATGRHVESFRFASYAEYTRQPGRLTKTDLVLHDRVRAFHAGAEPPPVRHAPASDGRRVAGAGRPRSPRPGFGARLGSGLERAIEELGEAIDRLRADASRRNRWR